MDVTLILTHRCNLNCDYCYAGEHHKARMTPEMIDKSVDLVFADGADSSQLGFFGGEPLLAFDLIQQAVARAEERSVREGRRLVLQCTTNGTLIDERIASFLKAHDFAVTVSIDGTREAHELNRPSAGGHSSYDAAITGLQELQKVGVNCDVLMVISPQTVSMAYLGVHELFGLGVRKVRANLALNEEWSEAQREELREQIISIGWEVLARRLRGEAAAFEPFERTIRRVMNGGPSPRGAPRSKVVVSTHGHLYPCAPMVGEDLDDSANAALRMAHIDDEPELLQMRVSQQGVACSQGGRCECAAFLETGDRQTPGELGTLYRTLCQQVGETIANDLKKKAQAEPARRGRRPMLIGAIAATGAAVMGAAAYGFVKFTEDEPPIDVAGGMPPCDIVEPAGEMRVDEPVPDGDFVEDVDDEPIVEGEMVEEDPPPPPPPGQMPVEDVPPPPPAQQAPNPPAGDTHVLGEFVGELEPSSGE